MHKFTLAAVFCAVLLCCAPAFAIDGQVLINQSTVMAAGGFPYRITQPGSYKLSGNLVVPANTVGIEVNVAGVTLDLGGFSISGPATCTGLGSNLLCSNVPATETAGILASIFGGTAIRNGAVRGFTDGIEGSDALLENLQVTSNTFRGINMSGGILRQSVISYNGGSGIEASATTIDENSVDFNQSYGLVASNCTVNSNTFVANSDDTPGNQIQLHVSASGHNNICSGTTC